ncbi:hypothetical protein C9439_02130 [archaeon SCG-AAA382B04]|nr:hypothetical protein C9439_02130 [archaeon SCG-AAA382B04]
MTDRTAVYLRTSTEDQDPENQREDCLNFVENKIDPDEVEVFKEKETAWNKSRKRDVFEELLDRARKGEFSHIVVWDFDRLYRLRKKTVRIVKEMASRDIEIHSVNQQWLEELHNIPSPWDEIMFNLMLQIVGWMGEEESRKRSRRVKSAYQRKKNKEEWGRSKADLPMKRIHQLKIDGYSYNDILEELELDVDRSTLCKRYNRFKEKKIEA